MEANSIVNQIMGSANPQEAFNRMLSTNKDASNAFNIVQQYGNGDAKAAFINYANSCGKTAIAQKIIQMLGLK